MSAPVLVAYATRYGSTQEVAEAVATMLRVRGLEVDVQPMQEVRTLEGYRAVVLGAPLYMGRWHKDAQRFLLEHREALMDRPVAIFALGPLGTDEREIMEARNELDEELEQYPCLTPVALEVFGGKYDPAQLRFSDRLIAKLPASPLHEMPPSDMRDWTAIRYWAGDLAQQLRSNSPQ
jgi:menaquinone-dependent protoporphyrinogen oxidase